MRAGESCTVPLAGVLQYLSPTLIDFELVQILMRVDESLRI